MIIGVTLLSTLAAFIAAVAVGVTGGTWLAIVGSYLVAGWIFAAALMAMAVAREVLSRDVSSGPGGNAPGAPSHKRHAAVHEVPRHNRPARSSGSLHA